MLNTNKKIPINTDEMNIPIHLNFPDGFLKKKQQQHVSYATIGK